jgi:hypothetical protein
MYMVLLKLYKCNINIYYFIYKCNINIYNVGKIINVAMTLLLKHDDILTGKCDKLCNIVIA